MAMMKKCSDKTYNVGLWITLICLTHFSEGAWLRCYKGALEKYSVAPLDQPLPNLFMSCIDPTLPTVVYTFGYRGRSDGPATKAMLDAYIKRKKRNVLLLDWEEEAKSGVLGIPLGYAFHAVPKAKKVGKEMGETLMKLHEAGMNMQSVHLVGHSLGAHIMGLAGKRTREMGHIMPRITGLDPARALFEGTFAVQNGLDRTCARFVDIIHSDAGGYGTSTSSGTVDIWPNYGSEASQPGCPSGDFDMFTPEELYQDVENGSITVHLSNMQTLRKNFKRLNLCSHDRAWRYYAEAISSPTAFPAIAANDYDSWVTGAGQNNQTIYLGDLTNTRAQGNYYLTTNSKPFYGKGNDGMKPTNQTTSKNISTTFKLIINLR